MIDINLLKGAFDLHVHSAPDIVPRLLDDVDLAKLYRNYGFGGFIIKNHYSPTYDRAYLVRRIVNGIDVFGGIVLNNSVGGLNPRIVYIAGRSGAKIVWFPTVDSINERSSLLNWRGKPNPPAWAKAQLELYDRGLLGNALSIFDEDGRIKPEIDEILDIIKEFNMALATGHLSPNEGIQLVKRAVERGVKKIIITHPEFPTTRYNIEQQKELVNYGVYFERCYESVLASRADINDIVRAIRETGIERNILSTDLGQVHHEPPPQGYVEFIEKIIKHGLTKEEIEIITKENQRKLLY
ncbi:hypothetical protein GCM10007112_07730 [Vulcanisaeta souniana JCM 11219]|nr:hypothetical protein GCM10007112_07730 [Vulcanisaeta souniana JCM 11219]